MRSGGGGWDEPRSWPRRPAAAPVHPSPPQAPGQRAPDLPPGRRASARQLARSSAAGSSSSRSRSSAAGRQRPRAGRRSSCWEQWRSKALFIYWVCSIFGGPPGHPTTGLQNAGLLGPRATHPICPRWLLACPLPAVVELSRAAAAAAEAVWFNLLAAVAAHTPPAARLARTLPGARWGWECTREKMKRCQGGQTQTKCASRWPLGILWESCPVPRLDPLLLVCHLPSSPAQVPQVIARPPAARCVVRWGQSNERLALLRGC